MVPATQTVMLHLLAGKHQRYTNWPQHQVMVGHTSRVNCLLYPNNEHPRYDVAHLVSGSVDFREGPLTYDVQPQHSLTPPPSLLKRVHATIPPFADVV